MAENHPLDQLGAEFYAGQQLVHNQHAEQNGIEIALGGKLAGEWGAQPSDYGDSFGHAAADLATLCIVASRINGRSAGVWMLISRQEQYLRGSCNAYPSSISPP